MPEYFDIHSHLNFPDYADDRGSILSSMKEKGVYTVTVGTDFETSKSAVELAQSHPHVFACIGVHPVDDPKRVFRKEEFLTLVTDSNVVAIGECGLDYFRLVGESIEEKKRQRDQFEEQIQFAIEHGKLLMIHSRSAYHDTASILESYAREYGERLWGNVHFFAGDTDIAQRFLDINFSLSFTGVITFARDYDEVIRMLPSNMILSETDAPYVSPAPFRGKRNEPSYVSYVVQKIAEIRGVEESEMKRALVQNALNRFQIAS